MSKNLGGDITGNSPGKPLLWSTWFIQNRPSPGQVESRDPLNFVPISYLNSNRGVSPMPTKYWSRCSEQPDPAKWASLKCVLGIYKGEPLQRSYIRASMETGRLRVAWGCPPGRMVGSPQWECSWSAGVSLGAKWPFRSKAVFRWFLTICTVFRSESGRFRPPFTHCTVFRGCKAQLTIPSEGNLLEVSKQMFRSNLYQ